ncbi:MAG: putative adhesin, partial [Candidatus Rhabdochlamydia sp.]
PITTKPIEKSLFEVIQKNIQERSYLDANVAITSDRELMLKNILDITKSIEMLLLIPSLAFPILNWVSLAALVTETALNLYIAKNGDTVKERRQAVIDAGISSLEFLLIGAFLHFRSLKFSKNQNLSEIARQDRGRPYPIASGSGVFSFLKKAPVSEELFFGTTKSMQVWQITTPDRLLSHFDVKAWFLDEQFLLFTGKTNKAKHLIISSHGGYFPGSGIVKVPENTELVVLGPHGWQILDPKTSKLARRLVLPYGVINESQAFPTQTAFHPSLFSLSSNTHIHPQPTNIKILAGTDVPGHIKNYSLSKYQKFGFGEESYLDIVQIVNRSRNTLPLIHEVGLKPVDVLTIRNRGGIFSPNLKDVFTSLQNYGIHYDRITLDFCRSNAFLSMIHLAPSYIPATL